MGYILKTHKFYIYCIYNVYIRVVIVGRETRVVTFKIDEELLRRVDECAAKLRVSRSDFIRMAVLKLIEQHRC